MIFYSNSFTIFQLYLINKTVQYPLSVNFSRNYFCSNTKQVSSSTWPLTHLLLNSDTLVCPCCLRQRLSLGINIFSTTFSFIWFYFFIPKLDKPCIFPHVPPTMKTTFSLSPQSPSSMLCVEDHRPATIDNRDQAVIKISH